MPIILGESFSMDAETKELSAELSAERAALASYLSVVIAIGNSMAEVCPAVGILYRDRLMRLPRRLGFDPTDRALEQSREAVEMDLMEYASAASAWIQAGTGHAGHLLDHLRSLEESLVATADLERAFLEDIAEHIEASAEVDDEAQLRVQFHRYAAGLRAYTRLARKENLAAVDDLRRRRENIQNWIAEASLSDFTDLETGLPNRRAAQHRIETAIDKGRQCCVILVVCEMDCAMGEEESSASICDQIMRQLAERLAATIRPYDVIFRWSRTELITIFECAESDISGRTQQISGWLGQETYSVQQNGAKRLVSTRATVSVIEHVTGDSPRQTIAKIGSKIEPKIESGTVAQ
jgi:GGDEF domain-containing protein